LSFFKDNTATIYVIAITGARLDIGQERSKEETALTAEPHCGPDLIYPRTQHATEFIQWSFWFAQPPQRVARA